MGVCVRCLPVRVDSDAVAAQQRAAQDAVVAAAVALVHRDHHQAAFGGLDVLHRAVFDFLTGQMEMLLAG